MVGQLDHLVGVVCGFVDDGQVEEPARRNGSGLKRLYFICGVLLYFKEQVTETENKAEQRSVSQHRTFAGLFPPVVV